jgi:hypothetical protein
MTQDQQQLIDDFNGIIKECEDFCCITRHTTLQREARERLLRLSRRCMELKGEAIAAEDENFANLLLGFQCVCSALEAELSMWILLKEETPNKAWDELIRAQMSTANAARAHRGFSHLKGHGHRLQQIEELVFPPQVFVSAGLVVGYQECSICGGEYGNCEHIAVCGRIL